MATESSTGKNWASSPRTYSGCAAVQGPAGETLATVVAVVAVANVVLALAQEGLAARGAALEGLPAPKTATGRRGREGRNDSLTKGRQIGACGRVAVKYALHTYAHRPPSQTSRSTRT